ncbi:IS110 family transposase [Paenibacillus filicis]|uniref:IS110 family transposase n=1 Tax=Paenibacillus filicis TaxID=669464 RepID=A0ABU9DD97_9BACL
MIKNTRGCFVWANPAQRIKNVPGRKTDVSDAEWIAKLLRHGLIEPSFVPQTDLRELTRLRKKQVGGLTAKKNRLQKVLECANIKLGTVISDVFGVSGRNLLKRLMEQGFIDPSDIEGRVKGNVKKKVPELADSLFGTLDEHQMFMIRFLWNEIAFYEESIRQLDERIEEYLVSYKEEMELMQTMPGVKRITAASILAEMGHNMNQLPTAAHLTSWAGVSPGNHESAGQKKYPHSKRESSHQNSFMRGGLGCF